MLNYILKHHYLPEGEHQKDMQVYRTIKAPAVLHYIMLLTLTASNPTLTRSHLHKPVVRNSRGPPRPWSHPVPTRTPLTDSILNALLTVPQHRDLLMKEKQSERNCAAKRFTLQRRTFTKNNKKRKGRARQTKPAVIVYLSLEALAFISSPHFLSLH